MTKYECNVNGSQNEAGITITVSDGSVIESFTVSDANKLNDLIQQIKQFDDKYVDIDELKTVLKNESQKDVINATNLNGLSSDKYAKSSDLDKYSTVPTNHSSRTVEYGVGDTNNYGHLKISDNPDKNDANTALSTKGAKTIQDKVSELGTASAKNSLRIFIGRNRTDNGEQSSRIFINQGEKIYARVVCNVTGYDYTKSPVFLLINGVAYEKSVGNDGKSEFMTINLNPGTYTVQAFVRGNDQVNTANDAKIMVVQ